MTSEKERKLEVLYKPKVCGCEIIFKTVLFLRESKSLK